MFLYYLFGLAIFLIARLFDKESVRFTLKAYLKFLIFLAFITGIRFYILSLYSADPDDLQIPDIPLWSLFGVWWEDMVFILPSILIMRNSKSKSKFLIVVPLMLASSFLFATGHLYQGTTWATITFFYIPVIGFLGKKNGVGTTAACHVTYDVITFLTPLLWALIR